MNELIEAQAALENDGFTILKSAVSVLDPPTGKAQKFIGTIPWQSS